MPLTKRMVVSSADDDFPSEGDSVDQRMMLRGKKLTFLKVNTTLFRKLTIFES
jgi:hypothetical protein